MNTYCAIQRRTAQGSRIGAGIEAQWEGRSEIPSHAGTAGKVGSSPDGLSQAEAQKRLTQYGPNEVEEEKADCGIAGSGATDAVRAAASIALMTPGLSVIIDAIKESPPNEPTRTAQRALPKE